MICEQCNKRPATVHISKIENGKKTDIHLCDQCAMQNNLLGVSTSFTISDLLSGLLNNVAPIKVDVVQEPKCNVCGLSYDKFTETGRFGCSNCYKVFGDRLNPLFKRVHGNIIHTGKIPESAGSIIKTIRRIEKLKQELEMAIRNEEYEKAAEIRDSIRELNKERGEAKDE